MGAEPESFHPRFSSELRELVDSPRFEAPLNIVGRDEDFLYGLLRQMLRIRGAEEAIATFVERGLARAPCHLGIGQEAVAVGVSIHLRSTDRVLGGHRSHSHYLAMGGDLQGLMSEVLGKAEGSSRGMGGSMHLVAREKGFLGSVPLVGATIPIAVGAALASKLSGSDDVAVAYFGDGACEEGVLHESLNFASVFRLPILFVCENNLFSSHLDIGLRQPSDRVARFAEAHRIASATVDGNDVLTVSDVSLELISRSRAHEGPGFLEAITYRHRGHVGPKEDVDVGVRRRMEDLAYWRRRDPVTRLRDALVSKSTSGSVRVDRIAREVDAEIEAAVGRATAGSYPPVSNLYDFVYAAGRES
jgi:pyruvate dehydrogenase E1 component alpha subunit